LLKSPEWTPAVRRVPLHVNQKPVERLAPLGRRLAADRVPRPGRQARRIGWPRRRGPDGETGDIVLFDSCPKLSEPRFGI
jgi:hypothetical protein